jgi:predicted Fe-S protein YdhL (DUF1289 family)
LHRFQSLPPSDRERVIENWKRWQRMSPDERRALRERWRAMSPEERREALQRRLRVRTPGP